MDEADVLAVGSRTQHTADAFAREFEIPRAYGTYQALADDPDIDVIYIGTPHSLHYENTLMALEAGKAVLCEKAFAINLCQAQEMVTLAREKNLFLMEAMWMRFMPSIRKMQELLPKLGELRLVSADFGFRAPGNPDGRLFDKSLGGGALLDVGVYPVSFAYLVLGMPDRILTTAQMGESGVDVTDSIIFEYGVGAQAVLHASIIADTRQEAFISGKHGFIRMPGPFWYTDQVICGCEGDTIQTIEVPKTGRGYTHEALEVMRCIREGRVESDIMPHQATLEVMAIMDGLREAWGLSYDAD